MERFIHVDRCDSTQDLLKEQLSEFPNDELTVSCEHQTLGRGRGGNTWEDSPGTLCFSMTIHPHLKPTFTALELSTLVANFFSSKGMKIQLKWPNDLITSKEKKCGGILIQNIGSNSIAGIGINLFQQGQEYGGIYETSFPIEKKSWTKELAQYIRDHRFHNTDDLIKQWMNYCFHRNREVRIFEGPDETIGLFTGLGPYGEAILQNESGEHHLYNGSLRLI